MIRKIIRIDKEKCNGCGACADACHEGAIDIINGKAELVREHFCDGLGDCLPECPTGAISFEEREAPEYDEEAVKEAQKKLFAKKQAMSAHTGWSCSFRISWYLSSGTLSFRSCQSWFRQASVVVYISPAQVFISCWVETAVSFVLRSS